MDQIPPGADLSLIPIVPPPYPGYQPKLKGKAELEDVTIAICATVIALQCIFLGIRFLTKIKAKTLPGLDDWCALGAAVLCCGLSYCVIFNRSQGRHFYDLSVALATDPVRNKVQYAALILVGPTVFMGKVALLTLYLKLFGHMEKVCWSIYAALVVGLMIVAMAPLSAVTCGTAKGAGWRLINPTCGKNYWYGIVQGTTSLALDIFILILPIPIIMHLNLARRKRYGVLLIFLTGIVAIIADAIVLKFRVDLYLENDAPWAGFVIWLCSIVEAGISVVCSSMPTLAQFSRQYLSKWGFFLTIRSYLSRREDSEPRTQQPSLPIPKPRKRYDPYSINMPTDSSVTKLSSYADVEMSILGQPAPASGRDVRKAMSIEQSSMRYSESSARNMV